MNPQTSSKLKALAMVLMMNSLMIGGIAYLFSGAPSEQQASIRLAAMIGRPAAFC